MAVASQGGDTKILSLQQTVCSSPSPAARKHEKGKAKRRRGQNKTETLSVRKPESRKEYKQDSCLGPEKGQEGGTTHGEAPGGEDPPKEHGHPA